MIDIECRYKFIDNTNNEYIVTENGDIYSYKRNKIHKLSKSICSKNNKKYKGYYKCTLCVDNRRTYVMVHRIVAKYFVEGYFEGAVVNHKDGNSLNNNFKNLEWVTQKDNIEDGNKRNKQTSTKWYYKWKIIFGNGECSPILNGQGEIKKYIKDNNLECSYTGLLRNRKSKGYKLEMIE